MKKSVSAAASALFLIMLFSGVTAPAQQSAGRLPDLVVDKIYLTRGCHVAGVIRNLGPGDIPDEVWTATTPKSAGVYLYHNGSKWGGGAIWRFDPAKHLQAPGGTATFVSNLYVAGSAVIRMEVDIWDGVLEANEADNSKEARLTCKGQAGKPGSAQTRSYWYDPPLVLPMWPSWELPGAGGGTDPDCERCILNCMGNHSYRYCRRICEQSGHCEPIKPR